MLIEEYQKWTKSTAIYPKEYALEYLALGLSSEAGEVAGKVKKLIRDAHLDNEQLLFEIGDCFWYLARLCDELGVNCNDVLTMNSIKLDDRKKRDVLGGSGDAR